MGHTELFDCAHFFDDACEETSYCAAAMGCDGFVTGKEGAEKARFEIKVKADMGFGWDVLGIKEYMCWKEFWGF